MCEHLLKVVSESPESLGPYEKALGFLAVEAEGVDDPDLVSRVGALEVTARGLSAGIYRVTQQVVLGILLSRPRKARNVLASSMFLPLSGGSKLLQNKYDLLMYFTALEEIGKDCLLRNTDKVLVAIRWLSFRSAIRRDPSPLTALADAIAEAVKAPKQKIKPGERDEGWEAEKFHYDLVELMSLHAASGQSGVDFKRLKRAQSDGEDLTALMSNGGAAAIEMKRFLLRELEGSSYSKLMLLSEEVRQLIYYLHPCQEWSGCQVGALVFAHLLFVLQVEFSEGRVERIQQCPSFPSFKGSKEPMLQLYDRERLYQPSAGDPDVVFDTEPSDGFSGLVALVNRICEVNGQAVDELRFETDDGIVLEVVAGEELLYCGRNSVVLSCRRPGEQACSSVLKVQPEADSRREEEFHRILDQQVHGVRQKLSSGRVLGAGIGLRFIRLSGFGAPFISKHMTGENARVMAEAACKTLQDVHRCGVLHRDIKPNNFIVVDGSLLLNDFDLSCHMNERLERCVAVGTSLFASPRCTRKGFEHEEVDDWLSLGLTLTYLRGIHLGDTSKEAALRSLASAHWAPELLRTRVAAGLVAT